MTYNVTMFTVNTNSERERRTIRYTIYQQVHITYNVTMFTIITNPERDPQNATQLNNK